VHSITRDRRERDEKLLVYTGAPLASDLEVTGHPMVTLELSSTESDGAVFVYLVDVTPNGDVDHFKRIPEHAPTLTIFRDAARASRVILPVMPR
jgi:X-Pro dipeptidyl-peptidase C-terminal non-catalytic domain